MERGTQINIWYFILALLGVVLLRDLWIESSYVDPIPYSVFEQYVAEGIVDEVTISDNTVRGTLKEPRNGKSAFVANRVEPGLAEQLREKGITFSGAADDLAKATDIARSMAARYGMDPDLGSVSYDADRTTFLGQNGPSTYFERRYSEATAAQLDKAVKQIIASVFERTEAILKSRRKELDQTAKALLERETLDADTLRSMIASAGAQAA